MYLQRRYRVGGKDALRCESSLICHPSFLGMTERGFREVTAHGFHGTERRVITIFKSHLSKTKKIKH